MTCELWYIQDLQILDYSLPVIDEQLNDILAGAKRIAIMYKTPAVIRINSMIAGPFCFCEGFLE
ncbi:hypothetical protein D1872_213580 [compost metagenome]